MALYKNKYRIESARLPTWNYGNAGCYFLTICTHERQHFFGQIEHGEMILNETGNLVQEEWLKTPSLRPDMNLTPDAFVVMPNHFHGIINIGVNEFNTCRDGMLSVPDPQSGVPNEMYYFPTSQNKFAPQSKNLSSIVRGFKSAVTISTRSFNPGFKWQTRFHNHIIRDQETFITIQHYIINNPALWENDKFYT